MEVSPATESLTTPEDWRQVGPNKGIYCAMREFPLKIGTTSICKNANGAHNIKKQEFYPDNSRMELLFFITAVCPSSILHRAGAQLFAARPVLGIHKSDGQRSAASSFQAPFAFLPPAQFANVHSP